MRDGKGGSRRPPRTALFAHVMVFALANLGILGANLVMAPHRLWFLWPLLAWGALLLVHAFRPRRRRSRRTAS